MMSKREINRSMFFKTIALMLLAVCTAILAQAQEADSLEKLLNTELADSARVMALNELGWKLMYQDPDTSVILGLQALSLSKKAKDSINTAHSLSNLGVYHWVKSEYKTGLAYLEKALEIRMKLKDKQGAARVHNNMGMIYRYLSNYPKAFDHYFESLSISTQLENKQEMAKCYNNIGIAYEFQSDYEQALENYLKSLEIEEYRDNKEGMASSYSNIGNIYYYKSDYSKEAK